MTGKRSPGYDAVPYGEHEPRRIARLHHDSAGRPVPWFVQWFDGDEAGDPGVGRPDFRIVDQRKLVKALKDHRCFTCGEPFHGPAMTFPIGPMCVINRISSEPPSHGDCAEYAARNCPWLTNPEKDRRGADGPGHGTVRPAGMVGRNPGVTVLWKTKSYLLTREKGTILLEMGTPQRLTWFRQGRQATDDEIARSFVEGLAVIAEVALGEGPDQARHLHQRLAVALPLLPAGARQIIGATTAEILGGS